MNIVDIVIIATIIICMMLGFVRGFLKQTVTFIGTILVVILAFIFKSPLSLIMYKNLPFFKFGGIFQNLTSLNILMYETLAFIIALVVLSIVLGVILKVTGLIEKALKATIILAIPSKILGMIVGFVQAIVIIYVSLFIVSLPIINLPYLSESKYANIILEKTPFLSSVTDGIVKTYDEISEFIDESSSLDSATKNRNMVDVMLKNGVTTPENIRYLVDKGKLEIYNVDELLEKYEEE
ncbi:MAG TPA: CvpA family protein [Bacilli bacterium]|nr:CvpA family protein [Bacilli bacterium]